MKPLFTRCLLIVACFWPLPATVYADATADARSAILASLNAQMDAEQKQRDPFADLAIYAPDFKGTDANGTAITLKEMEKAAPSLRAILRTAKAQLNVDSYKITIVGIVLKGDKAGVIYRQDQQITIIGPPSVHPGTRHSSFLVRTVWKKYGNRWLMENESILPSGLLVQPPGHAH